MSPSDKDHFESYRPQTLAKHTILKNYITAYFHILKRSEDRIIYIDGFAGRGTYTAGDGSAIPGSPRHALELIASTSEFAAKVRTIFIERDRDLFAQLAATLRSFGEGHPDFPEPILANGAFSTEMTVILDSWKKSGAAIAPMFVFIDPCGVDGVDFAVIQRLLRAQRKCEVFLFFNIEGVRRILGLRDQMGDTLAGLLGTQERADELVRIVDSLRTNERDGAIIRYYEGLLRENLVHRPDNRLCETAYRNALLELERETKILVLSPDGRSPAPKRRLHKGSMTLGESHYVKLR